MTIGKPVARHNVKSIRLRLSASTFELDSCVVHHGGIGCDGHAMRQPSVACERARPKQAVVDAVDVVAVAAAVTLFLLLLMLLYVAATCCRVSQQKALEDDDSVLLVPATFG